MIEISASQTTPVEAFRSMGALLDAVGACIFSKDLLGRYTYVNRPMLTLLGCDSVAEVLGREAGDYVDQQSAERIREHDLRVLHLAEEIESEETNVFGRNGEQRVFWTVKKPMRDSGGEIIGLCGVSTDITERKAIEAQLQEQRQLLLAVLNHIDSYVYMKDETRRYRFVNEKVAREWGISAEEAVGKRDVEVMPLERADKFWQLDQQVFELGQPQIGEESFPGPDGEMVHHWSIKVPIRYEGVPSLIGLSTDITEVVRLREKLREQAIRDALTGLFNRRHFNELAEKELARSRRHGHPTAMVMLDIDHFKRINDGHGHPAGDAVLQRVGELLRAQVRQEDTAARIGGEEFALLLPRTEAAQAGVLAERIRCAVREAEDLLPDAARVTISLGVAVSSGEMKLEALYAAADAQLYRAKQGGRDRVCCAEG
jgi:diguanylate cyclase (GGDEF)-like protein/PAS domain S-box-containing protein